MNFNLKCDSFKSDLLEIINESKLPICVIYYILQNIYNQIQRNYYGTINQLQLEEQHKITEGDISSEEEKQNEEG